MSRACPKLPCKFQLGATVYHVLDTGGEPGMVCQINFTADGGHIYMVTWGGEPVTGCYEMELSTARTFAAPADQLESENK